jgi:ribosomal protein S18 acetylase RimI-like enzyme
LGLSHARIETLDQNEIGQTLYPSMGFEEVARQVHYCLDLSDQDH